MKSVATAIGGCQCAAIVPPSLAMGVPLKTQVNDEGNTAQLAGAAPERFVALTLDDKQLLTADVAPLTKAADGFIESIGPEDRVGIFTTSATAAISEVNGKRTFPEGERTELDGAAQHEYDASQF